MLTLDFSQKTHTSPAGKYWFINLSPYPCRFLLTLIRIVMVICQKKIARKWGVSSCGTTSQNVFMAIHPDIVRIFYSGPKWCTTGSPGSQPLVLNSDQMLSFSPPQRQAELSDVHKHTFHIIHQKGGAGLAHVWAHWHIFWKIMFYSVWGNEKVDSMQNNIYSYLTCTT